MRCLLFWVLPLAGVAACTFPTVTYLACPDCLSGAQTCTEDAGAQHSDCVQHCKSGQQGCMMTCSQAFEMARATCIATCATCSTTAGCADADAGAACVATVYAP